LSSNDVFLLQSVPESILILGGGVIGCEFAFILSALGSRVTIVEAMDRMIPLPCVDEDCSRVIHREMKKRKIRFLLERTIQEVSSSGARLRLTIGPSPFIRNLKEKGMESQILEMDKMLVCVGRQPASENTGLEKLGIRTDDRGWIMANEYLETSATHVYAVGDVLGPGRPMLAHMASTEGVTAVENALGGRRAMHYGIVPGVIFTMPEVAHVGLTELQAKKQGYHVRADTVLLRTVGKAQITGEIAGHAKIVSNAETGKILGVHLVGAHASELIAEGTLALQLGGTVKDLADTIHAHPTLAESMLEVSLKAMGRPLHG
jgi:dihydrolipoamide dehydrogenase